MEHEKELEIWLGKNRILALFAKNVNLWRDVAFMLTLVLNFFIIFSYSIHFGDPNDDDYSRRMYNPRLFFNEGATNTLDLFKTLGIIMIFCSSFVVLFFLIKKAPLVVKKAWSMDILGVEKGRDGSKN